MSRAIDEIVARCDRSPRSRGARNGAVERLTASWLLSRAAIVVRFLAADALVARRRTRRSLARAVPRPFWAW
jgi:hypothetical protein